MSVLRAVLAAVAFLVFAAGSWVFAFAGFPLAQICSSPERRSKRYRLLVKRGFSGMVRLVRLLGLLQIDISPADRARLGSLRGVVVAANHPTLVDVIILLSLLGDATALAKHAAARNPFYARIVQRAFLVGGETVETLEAARALLAQGVNVVVFPEGTRTPPGEAFGPLRRGAAQIALAARAPVWSVWLSPVPRILAKRQPWYAWGCGRIRFRVTLAATGPLSLSAEESALSRHAAAVRLTARLSESWQRVSACVPRPSVVV